MPQNIPTNRKLLIVSDTGMMMRGDALYGFGPVVIEVAAFLTVFDEVTWIGFDETGKSRASAFLKADARVKPIVLKKVGGKNIKGKTEIIRAYPKMFSLIKDEISKHQFIHARAPSNPAFIAMGLSKLYPKKKFWFKYAGDWKAKTSIFYKLQRRTLKNLNENAIITINGISEKPKKTILSFENPCVYAKTLVENERHISEKNLSPSLTYCFVGNLNDNKGIALLLNAWISLPAFTLHKLHIVGDGPLMKELKGTMKNYEGTIVFHGSLPKDSVEKVFKESHFTVLPSKSEGFPKVIGEAMSFGSVPIVSNISCISSYVAEGVNGFLIAPLNEKTIATSLLKSTAITNETFKSYVAYNQKLAFKFTYENYIERLKTEIFKIC